MPDQVFFHQFLFGGFAVLLKHIKQRLLHRHFLMILQIEMHGFENQGCSQAGDNAENPKAKGALDGV